MADEDVRRYSSTELRAMVERGDDQTRWDAPESDVDEEFWKQARLAEPGVVPNHFGIEVDVSEWVLARGEAGADRMDAVLRAYMEARKGS